MQRIPAVQFTYDIWRVGSLLELGIPHREPTIAHFRHYIKELAVGFCEGHKLHFRPKPGYVAVMFYIKNSDRHFWTHLTTKEFKICFPELEKSLKMTRKDQ